MNGTNLTARISARLPTNCIMHRNNVGVGWQGKKVVIAGETYIKPNKQPVKYGLCVGSSDLIGYTIIELNPDNIAQFLGIENCPKICFSPRKIAIFTAIEVKGDGDKESPEQKLFIERIRAAGGLAGFARSVQDSLNIINSWKTI